MAVQVTTGEHTATIPLTMVDLARMQATVGLGPDDVAALRRSRALLEPRVEAILDVWYGFVGSQPHLLAAFSTPEGAPIGRYLAAVRVRFAQWILDTASADYDSTWLARQQTIGARHHRSGKNLTDGVQAASHVRFSDLLLLTAPIVATLRPFLAADGADPDAVSAMQTAWLKAVLLQVTLWSRGYVPVDY